jgi:intracellular sulfur oxidation DsrE/DsrF family protein
MPKGPDVMQQQGHTAYLFTGDTLGRGDDELGRQLVAKLVLQLAQQEPKPQAILCYNTAVRLLAEASPCADGMRTLEQEGVDVIACGTCVDRFQLRGRLAAGRISDMRDIVATLNASAKVVTV